MLSKILFFNCLLKCIPSHNTKTLSRILPCFSWYGCQFLPQNCPPGPIGEYPKAFARNSRPLWLDLNLPFLSLPFLQIFRCGQIPWFIIPGNSFLSLLLLLRAFTWKLFSLGTVWMCVPWRPHSSLPCPAWNNAITSVYNIMSLKKLLSALAKSIHSSGQISFVASSINPFPIPQGYQALPPSGW